MAVLNKYRDKVPPDAINIMRPSSMGNPFRIGSLMTGHDGTREQVLDLHKRWLWDKIYAGDITAEELAAMDGHDLVCCCRPKACHGDEVERAIRWAVEILRQRKGETT